MEQSPEIDLYMYSQLIFNKGAKSVQREKDSFLNSVPDIQKQKINLHPYLAQYIKINLGRWDITAQRYRVSFRGNENVLM